MPQELALMKQPECILVICIVAGKTFRMSLYHPEFGFSTEGSEKRFGLLGEGKPAHNKRRLQHNAMHICELYNGADSKLRNRLVLSAHSTAIDYEGGQLGATSSPCVSERLFIDKEECNY